MSGLLHTWRLGARGEYTHEINKRAVENGELCLFMSSPGNLCSIISLSLLVGQITNSLRLEGWYSGVSWYRMTIFHKNPLEWLGFPDHFWDYNLPQPVTALPKENLPCPNWKSRVAEWMKTGFWSQTIEVPINLVTLEILLSSLSLCVLNVSGGNSYYEKNVDVYIASLELSIIITTPGIYLF